MSQRCLYTLGGIWYSSARMSMKPIVNRMRRVRGQLEKLEYAIEHGASCEDVIPQFLAVKGATNAALAAYLKTALQECDVRHPAQRDTLITALTQL